MKRKRSIIIFMGIFLILSVFMNQGNSFAEDTDTEFRNLIIQLSQTPPDIQRKILEFLCTSMMGNLKKELLKQAKIRMYKTLKGHTGWVNTVAYRPDGKHLASGSSDRTIKIWDIFTGKEIQNLKGHTESVNAVAYRPDGKYLASGSWDKTIKIWDLSIGKEIQVLKGHTNSVNTVAYRPDGKYLASGSSDRTIKLWDLSTGEEVRVLKGHTESVNAVAYCPNGQCLVSSGDKTIKIWDLSTGEEIQVPRGCNIGGWVESPTYSPDGQCLAHGFGMNDVRIRIWDLSTGEEIQVLKGHTGGIQSVTYSPDGECLASGSEDRTIRIWDVSTGGEIQNLKGHTGWITSVTYSPDGKHLSSGSTDCTIRIWNLFDKEDQVVLNQAKRIIEGNEFDINQAFLLFMLEKNYQPGHSVNLTEAEEGSKAYFSNHSALALKLLNFKESFRALPANLRKRVQKMYHVLEADNRPERATVLAKEETPFMDWLSEYSSTMVEWMKHSRQILPFFME